MAVVMGFASASGEARRLKFLRLGARQVRYRESGPTGAGLTEPTVCSLETPALYLATAYTPRPQKVGSDGTTQQQAGAADSDQESPSPAPETTARRAAECIRVASAQRRFR